MNFWDFTVGGTLAVEAAAAPDGHRGVVGAVDDEITVGGCLGSRWRCLGCGRRLCRVGAEFCVDGPGDVGDVVEAVVQMTVAIVTTRITRSPGPRTSTVAPVMRLPCACPYCTRMLPVRWSKLQSPFKQSLDCGRCYEFRK